MHGADPAWAREPTGGATGTADGGHVPPTKPAYRRFEPLLAEGKQAKNRVHLDVRAAPGLDGDARMAALGDS